MKKILPIAALIVLIIWGVYDVVRKNPINSSNGNITTSIQARTAGTVDTKVGLENGNLAPDFELIDLDGKKVKLSDYRGQKVILNFWATWCPPCKAEIPDLEKFYSDNKDKNTVILGVDLTESEKNELTVSMFAKTNKMTYPILLDKESKVGEMYQVSGIPTSYIIDTKGVIKNKVVGPMDYERMKSMIGSMN